MYIKFNEFLNEGADKEANKYNYLIDYTYVKADSNYEFVRQTVDTAIEKNFYAICVLPKYLSYAKGLLKDANIKLVTIIDFPDGDSKLIDKIKEVNDAVSDDVDEVDYVIDYKSVKNLTKDSTEEDIQQVYDDIEKEIKEASYECHKNGVILKAVIETGILTYDEIKQVVEACVSGGVDYIMTSTGMNGNGAELDKVKFLRTILPDYIKIKVSGGIRNLEDIKKFLKYIDRIGTSVDRFN
jgi:deoxyribose-phosphate aldolase